MSAEYIPQEGDRVRLDWWASCEWLDVRFVGEQCLFGRTRSGAESSWLLSYNWFKVNKLAPLPESWHNVYPDFGGIGFRSPEAAEIARSGGVPLAVVHLIPDGDTYRVEVVRP